MASGSGVASEPLQEDTDSMISMTEKAAGKVNEIADAEGLQGQGLRLRRDRRS